MAWRWSWPSFQLVWWWHRQYNLITLMKLIKIKVSMEVFKLESMAFKLLRINHLLPSSCIRMRHKSRLQAWRRKQLRRIHRNQPHLFMILWKRIRFLTKLCMKSFLLGRKVKVASQLRLVWCIQIYKSWFSRCKPSFQILLICL